MRGCGRVCPWSLHSWSSISTSYTGQSLLSSVQTVLTDWLLSLRNFRLESWHTGHSLAATRNLGLLTLTAGAAASLYYFYTHIAQGEEMFPIAENSLIAGVWALMCVKWGLALAWAAHKYRHQYREYSLI